MIANIKKKQNSCEITPYLAKVIEVQKKDTCILRNNFLLISYNCKNVQ